MRAIVVSTIGGSRLLRVPAGGFVPIAPQFCLPRTLRSVFRVSFFYKSSNYFSVHKTKR